jgi:caa(3)-type oxidase subunit IV
MTTNLRARRDGSSSRSASLVFVGLLLLTAASSWLAEGRPATDTWVAVIVISIAGAKIHLVGRHFMQLRDAPLGLRLAFDIWIIAVSMLIIGCTASA